MTIRLATCLAVTAALTCAATAQAQTQAVTMNKSIVWFDRAALKTPEGASKMLRRLERAAARVCSLPVDQPLGIAPPRMIEDCRRQAVATAVASINEATLTAALESSAVVVADSR